MEKPRTIIVNEKDEIIGYKERGTLNKEDIYRVSALWLTNSNGEILLAKRHRNKSHNPGMWGPAVAGTVDEGESYEENIIKETEEEIGISGFKLAKAKKIRRSGDYEFFAQWFTLTLDKEASEFKIQEDEVEEVKWFTREGLLKQLKLFPEQYSRNLKQYLELFK